MFNWRLAENHDIPALRALMQSAIGELQKGFLTPEQIAASRHVMGLDTQLIQDGTYFLVLRGEQPAGCGGWSRRATLFGGDHTPGRNAAVLDPAQEPARIRAMYTSPAYARQGVGRLILSLCEAAATADGFRHVQLAATLSGIPLYTVCGYMRAESIEAGFQGVTVPLVKMIKRLV